MALYIIYLYSGRSVFYLGPFPPVGGPTFYETILKTYLYQSTHTSLKVFYIINYNAQ